MSGPLQEAVHGGSWRPGVTVRFRTRFCVGGGGVRAVLWPPTVRVDAHAHHRSKMAEYCAVIHQMVFDQRAADFLPVRRQVWLVMCVFLYAVHAHFTC